MSRRSWRRKRETGCLPILIVIGAAVIIWLAVSLYQAVSAPSGDTSSIQPVTYTLDSSALEDYLASLESA